METHETFIAMGSYMHIYNYTHICTHIMMYVYTYICTYIDRYCNGIMVSIMLLIVGINDFSWDPMVIKRGWLGTH